MIRIVSMSYVAVVAALVFGLYHVKLETQALERQKDQLTHEISKTHSDIDVLQAEWASLSAPDKISALTAKYLPGLRPTKPAQLAALSSIPLRKAPSTLPAHDPIEQLLSMVDLRGSGDHGDNQNKRRPTL
jgi:hypothetical protein